MCREEVLTCRVRLQVLDQPGDTIRFQTNLDFIEERYVRRMQRLLLKARGEHTLGAQTELPQWHFAVMQREAAETDVDGVGVKMGLVGRCDVHAQGTRRLLSRLGDGVELR